jgi:Ca2+:H+ antiporter
LVFFIPLAWASHFHEWAHGLTFALCFLGIVSLEKIFDWGGEQLAMYCGPDLGDLIIITLNNAVEATLAIILLFRCELKLLQSTITGVVLLHLLLVPGTSFLTGGARIWEQQLHPHRSQLNLTLLTIGVLALTIPAAFFAAIDTQSTDGAEGSASGPSDFLRRDLLRMSRGFAVILLAIYVCSRIYLHYPPGEKDTDAFMPHPEIPAEALRKEQELAEAEPEVNPWACIILLVITVALMGVTAEFLVDSINFVQSESQIKEEWFGIVLLPFVSFSADGAIAIVYFLRSFLRRFISTPQPPNLLAETRAIDLSIQFLLFWMPLVTLLGWWLNKPMSMLFDLFEVVLLVGACFLVNYVTADAKTNWAEGWVLLSFYIMIGISAWYYPGQSESRIMNACESIVEAIVNGVGQNDEGL